MNTLLEFLYSVKAVEYLIAIGFIAVFVVYWQILNARGRSEEPRQSREEEETRLDRAA